MFDTCGDPELVKLAKSAQDWFDAFKAKAAPRWLSMLGSSGTGKTHCASRLWNYAKSRSDWSRCDYFARKIFWPDFVHDLRAGDAFEMRTEMKRWPVLFLDDIGAERDASGFASEELNTLLCSRMGRWTIITSNKSFDVIERIDARLASRLVRHPNICVSVNTKDFAGRSV